MKLKFAPRFLVACAIPVCIAAFPVAGRAQGSCVMPEGKVCFEFTVGYDPPRARESCEKWGATYNLESCPLTGKVKSCERVLNGHGVRANFYGHQGALSFANYICARMAP